MNIGALLADSPSDDRDARRNNRTGSGGAPPHATTAGVPAPPPPSQGALHQSMMSGDRDRERERIGRVFAYPASNTLERDRETRPGLGMGLGGGGASIYDHRDRDLRGNTRHQGPGGPPPSHHHHSSSSSTVGGLSTMHPHASNFDYPKPMYAPQGPGVPPPPHTSASSSYPDSHAGTQHYPHHIHASPVHHTRPPSHLTSPIQPLPHRGRIPGPGPGPGGQLGHGIIGGGPERSPVRTRGSFDSLPGLPGASPERHTERSEREREQQRDRESGEARDRGSSLFDAPRTAGSGVTASGNHSTMSTNAMYSPVRPAAQHHGSSGSLSGARVTPGNAAQRERDGWEREQRERELGPPRERERAGMRTESWDAQEMHERLGLGSLGQGGVVKAEWERGTRDRIALERVREQVREREQQVANEVLERKSQAVLEKKREMERERERGGPPATVTLTSNSGMGPTKERIGSEEDRDRKREREKEKERGHHVHVHHSHGSSSAIPQSSRITKHKPETSMFDDMLDGPLPQTLGHSHHQHPHTHISLNPHPHQHVHVANQPHTHVHHSHPHAPRTTLTGLPHNPSHPFSMDSSSTRSALPTNTNPAFGPVHLHRTRTPPPPPVVVNLGTFVYPRLPFPYNPGRMATYPWSSLADEGSRSPTESNDDTKSKGKSKEHRKRAREVQATLLIPPGFLPTQGHERSGLTGAPVPSTGPVRIWGGGLVQTICDPQTGALVGVRDESVMYSTPAPAPPPFGGGGAGDETRREGKRRVYTDDSDILLCAVHAGKAGWRQVRAAKARGETMRVRVGVVGAPGNEGVEGAPGGPVRKYIGGWGERLLSGAGDGDVEDDGRSLLSAGWGNGHDGSGIEIIEVEFVKDAVRKLGIQTRKQRLGEYAERRAEVLGLALPVPDPSSSRGRFKRNRSPTPEPWDGERTLERKRRRKAERGPGPNGAVLGAVKEDDEIEEDGGRTIVFAFGAGGRLEAQFQYEAEVLKDLMFPRPKVDLANVNAIATKASDNGPNEMAVDGDESANTKDAVAATHVTTSLIPLPKFRPLVLENGVESFLIEESELSADNTDQDQRYSSRTLKISVLRRPSAVSTPVAPTPTSATPVAGVVAPGTQAPTDTITTPTPVPEESAPISGVPEDSTSSAQAEGSVPAATREAASALALAPLPAVDPTARPRSTSCPAGLEVAQVLAPALREGNVRFEKDGLVLVLDQQQQAVGGGAEGERTESGSGLKVIVHGWRWA